MKIMKAVKLWWLKHSRNEDKFVDSPLVNYREWNREWIGCAEPISFKDKRPDPLSLSRQERQNEMRRQIQEDIK